MHHYKNNWRKLQKFAQQQNESCFSEKLGIDFIEKVYKITQVDFNGCLTRSQIYKLRIIRMIGDFQLHGSVLRRYYKHNELLHKPYLIEAVIRYKDFCLGMDYSPVTIDHYTKIASKFLDYFDAHGHTLFCEISLSVIDGYIKTLGGYTYKTVEQQLCGLRSFLRFLFSEHLNSSDFSLKVPMVQARKQTRIPSVWPAGELKQLLSVIDRGSPLGKRDYAMILLVCRLGLRVGDLKELKFDNFHWGEKEIVLTQSKPTEGLSLPLLQDVGWAVIDYIQYGRPKIESSHVFVRHMAPFLPFSESDHLAQIIVKYMGLAHIPKSAKRKAGFHSLRHTLASRLLEKGTPLPVISDILGHTDPQSTAVYLKVDINKLKECPLTIGTGGQQS